MADPAAAKRKQNAGASGVEYRQSGSDRRLSSPRTMGSGEIRTTNTVESVDEMHDEGRVPPDQAVITRQRAYELLRRLDELLPVLPQKAEIYAVGGAAIAFEYDPADRRTQDIDCIIKRYREEVIEAAERVAEEAGDIPPDWLNEVAYQQGKLPREDDTGQRTSYQGTRLVVHSAGPERLLAMKLHASREKDYTDIQRLMELTRVDSVEAALSIYHAAYPNAVLPENGARVVAETTGDNAHARDSKNPEKSNPTPLKETVAQVSPRPESDPDAWKKKLNELGIPDGVENPPRAPSPAADAAREAERRKQQRNDPQR